MPTPAERYAASRHRQQRAPGDHGHGRTLPTPLVEFAAGLPFDLDPFQVEACTALQDGRGVLVAAPTGAGKTVVGEFAVHLALAGGRKAFYTTPIKALSNQKYADLVRRHGAASVGLLTGDNSVNPDAAVVVMTTEVLRNMLYAGSPALAGLGYVVMDEVHYLADRFRGAVWEEVIIHLPEDVLVVSLSATVSNAEEFGAWLDTVRGGTAVVVSEHRPVPLWQHVLVGTRLYDLFVDSGTETQSSVNPELVRLARGQQRAAGTARGGTAGRARSDPRPRWQRGHSASRAQVLRVLDDEALLPTITFIFSRAGCDAAVQQCLAWGVRLTTPAEREQISAVVDERCAGIGQADLAAVGYWQWREGLERGLAAHHAGMLPTFKETVEALFTAGLVKAVFATETLALGINMPARSVVLEKLVKFDGRSHADITAGEYTQLTGRAGRRGIDVEGHAVVVWGPHTDPEALAGLAAKRTYPLRSSFHPTYNMAVNLVAQVGRRRAREILETSFAQFQADRGVVDLARRVRSHEEALAGYAEAMTCHLGDFGEYDALRRAIGEREAALSRLGAAARREAARLSLERLAVGDVIRVPGGRRAGYAVVLDAGAPGGLDGPRPTVLTADRQVRRISALDVPAAVAPLARLRVPKSFNARSPHSRRDLASSLRNALAEVDRSDGAGGPDSGRPGARPRRRSAAADDAELANLRSRMRAHPCHGCAEREEHARWAQRWSRMRAETDGLLRRIEGRTNTIARTFDRVCDLLSELGYLSPDGEQVTEDGRRLRRLYAESDLLAAECQRRGSWRGLGGAGLAACVSTLVFESRREDRGVQPPPPPGAVADALAETVRVWGALADAEEAHRLAPTREPDLGFARAVFRWAGGARLAEVLEGSDLAAGDFVRWCKQVVDLLDQVGAASEDPELRAAARAGVQQVRRGVVAWTSLG